MSVRVTRQVIEVLGVGDGRVRVTRQYVEVIGPALEFALTSTLALTGVGVGISLSPKLTSTMALVSTQITGIPKSHTASNAMLLVNVVAANQFILNLPIEQQPILELIGVAGFNVGASVKGSNTLALTDTVVEVAAPGFFKFGVGKNTLALTQLFTPALELSRLFTSPISLQSAVAIFVIRDGSECQYVPFIGSSSDPDAPNPPPATAPVLGIATTTLTFPFISPITTLVLRNPEFGNTDRLDFSRIRRDTRGGVGILFADPNWPKQQILNLDISALSQDQADAFLAFVQESLGKEIGLLDHENRQWKGIIITPDSEITDLGGTCRLTTTFEFEGELQ